MVVSWRFHTVSGDFGGFGWSQGTEPSSHMIWQSSRGSNGVPEERVIKNCDTCGSITSSTGRFWSVSGRFQVGFVGFGGKKLFALAGGRSVGIIASGGFTAVPPLAGETTNPPSYL